MDNQILPVLDTAILKEKANEFAMKGAIETIKEYYTGYNSPFRKAIDAELQKQELRGNIDLPDIIGLINVSLSHEIDAIANEAISRTFMPLVSKFLTREAKEMKFSDVLKELIENIYGITYDDCSIEVSESKHGWLDIKIEAEKHSYQLTLHSDYESEKRGEKKYMFLSLPYGFDRNDYRKSMTLSIDEGTLEMPFTSDVLSDKFVSFIARLVIARTIITMDCQEFSEDMFPNDECHCD